MLHLRQGFASTLARASRRGEDSKMMVACYPTKKALRESIGKGLRYAETSMFGPEYKSTGSFCVVGPGALNRKWYAKVTMQDDIIAGVE